MNRQPAPSSQLGTELHKEAEQALSSLLDAVTEATEQKMRKKAAAIEKGKATRKTNQAKRAAIQQASEQERLRNVSIRAMRGGYLCWCGNPDCPNSLRSAY